MKKIISTFLALITIATLSGCDSSDQLSVDNSSNELSEYDSSNDKTESLGYKIENLDYENARIIENTPKNGKWQKMLYDVPALNEHSADRIVEFAANYGAGEIDKNDILMRLAADVVDDLVPLSDYYKYLPKDYLSDEDFIDFPYINMLYCSDDIYIEVQTLTGFVELDNRKNVNSILDLDFTIKGPWRPSFNSKSEALVDLNDENATCILNGKTVKIVDAIKNAEKYVLENEALFQKSFGAKVVDAKLYTYENGNQSLSLVFEYTIDGVPLHGLPSYAIDDENGNRYKTHPVMIPCGMLTENTLDWIWFPVIDGGTELTSEDCELTISREKACELVSQKLSQEYKFHIEEIQLMYAARRVETGKYSWEPSQSCIEPVWRFYITGIQAQEYHALYVYVSALDGEVQIAEAYSQTGFAY